MFSVSGLSKHLAMTRQPACAAVYEAQLDRSFTLPPSGVNTRLDVLSLPDPPDVDMDVNPVQFEGDYFGEYTDGDFDPPQSPEPSSRGSSSDDDPHPPHSGWEPEPNPPPPSATPVEPLAPESTAPVGPAIPSQARRQTIEKTIPGDRKTFTVPFPSPTAAAAIPADQIHSKLSSSTYHDYQHSVDPSGGSATNLYAPFTSRLDWEVARWAKLRGSGSTAFSDLLGIEEVRCDFIPNLDDHSTSFMMSGGGAAVVIIQELT